MAFNSKTVSCPDVVILGRGPGRPSFSMPQMPQTTEIREMVASAEALGPKGIPGRETPGAEVEHKELPKAVVEIPYRNSTRLRREVFEVLAGRTVEPVVQKKRGGNKEAAIQEVAFRANQRIIDSFRNNASEDRGREEVPGTAEDHEDGVDYDVPEAHQLRYAERISLERGIPLVEVLNLLSTEEDSSIPVPDEEIPYNAIEANEKLERAYA